MGKNLKQEFYYLRCNWLVLLLLLVLLIGNIVISNKDVVGKWTYIRVTHPYLDLYDEARFGSEMEYAIRRRGIDEVKEDLDMNSPQIEDLEDMYALYQRACYIRIMWYIGGLVLLAAVLPTALVRIPINTGVPDLSAKLCASRRCVALGKVLVYCLLVLLLSLLTALIQSAIYASSVMNQLGLGYCLCCLVWRMLQDLAVLSIPLYIAFLCHNAVLATVLNLGYGCLCCWLNILAAGQETVLFIPFPAFLHGLRSLWQPEASTLWLVASALVSLGYILVFGWLSVRQFAKAKTQP